LSIFNQFPLPQLISRSLPYRHEMSAFLVESASFIPKHPEGDKSAYSTPSLRICAYSLERRNTCSCRARH
jgi:hypothetical protein